MNNGYVDKSEQSATTAARELYVRSAPSVRSYHVEGCPQAGAAHFLVFAIQ